MAEHPRCPECEKNHRIPPRACYALAQRDLSHTIIANLASSGNPHDREFDRLARARAERMDEYLKRWAGDVAWKAKRR